MTSDCEFLSFGTSSTGVILPLICLDHVDITCNFKHNAPLHGRLLGLFVTFLIVVITTHQKIKFLLKQEFMHFNESNVHFVNFSSWVN